MFSFMHKISETLTAGVAASSVTEEKAVCVVTQSEHMCLSGSKTGEISVTCVFLFPLRCQIASAKERKQKSG